MSWGLKPARRWAMPSKRISVPACGSFFVVGAKPSNKRCPKLPLRQLNITRKLSLMKLTKETALKSRFFMKGFRPYPAFSTSNTVPSTAITLTLVLISQSSPCTFQMESSTLILPCPLIIGSYRLNTRPMYCAPRWFNKG